MASSVSPTASSTTATGLPRYGVAVKTSTWANRRSSMAATVRSADARVAGVPAEWGGLTRSALPGGDPVGDVPDGRRNGPGVGQDALVPEADGGDQAGVGPGGRETLTHPVGRLLVGAVVQDERVRHAAVRADKETPYRVGEGLAAAWPNARLVT